MEKGAWKDLVSPVEFMLYRTMLGFGVQLLQQFSGIYAVDFIPLTEGEGWTVDGCEGRDVVYG